MNRETTEKAWYETLYVDFDDYDDEPYTQHTQAEIDFIEATIGPDRGLRILDVSCGTGRHSLELARRGYSQITGVDLSRSMLARARAKAAAAGYEVTFLQRDARRLSFQQAFDVVLMLCEGGFSLMETDEMDHEILRGVARALQPGGRLIMTAPHAAFMLARLEQGSGFNPVTLREQFTLEKDGKELACSQRYYTFSELKRLLQGEGFGEIDAFAVRGDGYCRESPPAEDDYELGVMAIKE